MLMAKLKGSLSFSGLLLDDELSISASNLSDEALELIEFHFTSQGFNGPRPRIYSKKVRISVKVYLMSTYPHPDKNGSLYMYKDRARFYYQDARLTMIRYYRKGLLHRNSDKPAVVFRHGEFLEQEYFKSGKAHRMDGPAFLSSHSADSWYYDGVLLSTFQEVWNAKDKTKAIVDYIKSGVESTYGPGLQEYQAILFGVEKGWLMPEVAFQLKATLALAKR